MTELIVGRVLSVDDHPGARAPSYLLRVDLACFVVKIRATEPMLLWVAGLLFGLAIMAFAAWLEHQREGVLQRIRIYGHELRQWH